MFELLQSDVPTAAINGLGALLTIGGLAITWLWLRVFYRPSGISER